MSRTHDYLSAPPTDGKFAFSVNGTPIMVLGTNWVPLDAIHARDAERLPRALSELWNTNSNTGRCCWGGNLYEDTSFFDWCDERGILVRQDFALACARYPQSEPFLSELGTEATSIIKKLRNHACLLVWSGSNETDDSWVAQGIDPGRDIVTRQLLPSAVLMHGWATPYIEGSPAQPAAAAATRRSDLSPEQHLWGARASFKDAFYAQTNARFIGEGGVHGAISGSSIDKFIPPGHGLFDPDDRIWKLHQSDHRSHPLWYQDHLRLLGDQTDLYFRSVNRASRAEFIPASQIRQAEAYKFIIENTRLAKGQRSEVLWWSLLDCWPQVSASLVDYLFDRRLGYHYVRRSQQSVCMIAAEAIGWSRAVTLVNDSSWSGTVEFEISSVRRPDFTMAGLAHSEAGANLEVCRLPLAPSGDCYLFSWKMMGRTFANHYIEDAPPLELSDYTTFYLPAIANLDTSFRIDELWPE